MEFEIDFKLIEKQALENKEKYNEFLNKLYEANRLINLTSIAEKEAWEKHICDSLTGLYVLEKRYRKNLDTVHIADVGSGGGFPAVPLLIARQNLHLSMVESNKKKALFCNDVIKHFNFANAEVQPYNVREVKKIFDCVLFRSFSSMYDFLVKSKNIFSKKTMILAYKGKEDLINEEITFVKKTKLWFHVKGLKIWHVKNMPVERNLVEILWEK